MTGAFATAVALLDLIGVAVFATTGALMAARKQMDLVGFAFLATVTGIGGGTLRDLVLGQAPVFWVREPLYLVVCVAAATLVFVAAQVASSRQVLLVPLDAVGLALFAVIGADKALAHGPVVAAAMGVITAVMGGIIRDILGGEAPVIFHREIYATAALAGALAFIIASAVVPREAALIVGFLAALSLRALALRNGWSLPIAGSVSKRSAKDAAP